MDWIGLITKYLDLFLIRCFDQVSSETPQQYLASHYDPISGRMDESLVRSAMPQTRRAIVKARQAAPRAERRNFPRYGRDEIYTITETRLIEAMNASESEVAAVKSVAATMGDDD